MKFYHSRPVKELRIVRDTKGDQTDAEFWLLVPVYLGAARKVSTRHVEADDGTKFVNMNSAALHYFEQAKEGYEVANAKKPPPMQPRKLSGMDLVEAGKWADFCRLRRLNVRSPEHMQQEYQLTHQELEILALTSEADA